MPCNASHRKRKWEVPTASTPLSCRIFFPWSQYMKLCDLDWYQPQSERTAASQHFSTSSIFSFLDVPTQKAKISQKLAKPGQLWATKSSPLQTNRQKSHKTTRKKPKQTNPPILTLSGHVLKPECSNTPKVNWCSTIEVDKFKEYCTGSII